MSRFRPSSDVQPLSAFRAESARFLRELHKNKRPLVLTQRGRTAAVVLDAGTYDALMEELEASRKTLDALAGRDDSQGIPQEEILEALKDVLQDR